MDLQLRSVRASIAGVVVVLIATDQREHLLNAVPLDVIDVAVDGEPVVEQLGFLAEFVVPDTVWLERERTGRAVGCFIRGGNDLIGAAGAEAFGCRRV